MIRRSFFGPLALAAFFVLCCRFASAQSDTGKPAAKPATSSLDDELFQDLDLKAKPKPMVKPTATGEATKPPTDSKSANPSESKKSPLKDDAKRDMMPATKPSALDEELLKQLEGDDAPPRKKAQPSPPTGGAGGRADDDVSDNPFVRLSRKVRDAEVRLRGEDSGDQTQKLQRRIVDDLEQLIAQIERQQQSQSQSQSNKPQAPQPGEQKPGQPKQRQQQKGQSNPAEKPTDSGEQLADRKNEKPTTGQIKNLMEKVWGELPERQRQDVMQSSFDDFPVKYQYVIEEYFKTLLKRQD